jgi:hypothetical protein
VAWSIRTRLLVLCCCVLVAAACGDADANLGGVAVTVFAPSGGASLVDGSVPRLSWSLEYQVSCGASVDDRLTVEGTLKQVDRAVLELDGPTAVWKGIVEFEPGPCAIQLRARDADGEVVCTYTEALTFDSELPSEAYFNLICNPTCPTISFPGSETVSKTSCAPVGGLILSAETLDDAVQSVRYVVRDTETGFLDSVINPSILYVGELAPGSPGSVDLGGGPVPTHTWEAIVGVIASDVRYATELTALDADGTPLCSAGTSFEVLFGGIAQVHVVLPCTN